MFRKEYENPIEQVMFILGFKHDPRFPHTLDAMKAGSNPGIINAVDELKIYGEIHANFCALALVMDSYKQRDSNSSIISTDSLCYTIIKELNEKHYGGKWFPAAEKPPEHWINMGGYSLVFRHQRRLRLFHQGIAEVFCLPYPYFNLLSKVLEKSSPNDAQATVTKLPESGENSDTHQGVPQVPITASETLSEPEKRIDGEPTRLHGVRGWLLIFCILTAFIVPFTQVSDLINSTNNGVIMIDFTYAVFAIFTGMFVWNVKRYALKWVRVYLIGELYT